MRKYSRCALLIAGSIVSTIFASGAAFADPKKCNGLSGNYGTDTAIVVGSGGQTVNIVMSNGARPNAYGTCTDKTIDVVFPDAGRVTGIHDGKKISWGNNTTWTKSYDKAKMCNGLSGYYGTETAIVVGQDGQSVNVVMANGKRPNAYGTCTDTTIDIIFSDGGGLLKGTHDGKKISWANNTTWTKAN